MLALVRRLTVGCRFCLLLFLMTQIQAAHAQTPLYQPTFSTAGFIQVETSPRAVFDFNPGWRFFKGDVAGAEISDFDDANWTVVNVPHGIEPLPISASGSMNFQGPVWYRKHFKAPQSVAGKRVFLHFEAVMGKSKIWLNGHLLTEHFGGYLPIHLDITDHIRTEGDNVVCVRADNSDDPTFPPGKPQTGLDFTYFGGIYRDVWMVATSAVHITHANAVDKVAGGGVFFHTSVLDETGATVQADVDVVNTSDQPASISVHTALVDGQGNTVAQKSSGIAIEPGKAGIVTNLMRVTTPTLWHPDEPNLYDLIVTVKADDSRVLDAQRLRVGIRTVELRGKDGLLINGKPMREKLVGANRHQDFAHVGNAMSNTLHWRDAWKLRSAGMRIIRVAHYPQDPAFMDACDELGMFVIVATPGWQFFREGDFEKRVLADGRQMVRRDRNRACLFAWEPILNETRTPAYFDAAAADAVREEYPYPGCINACDFQMDAMTSFELMYGYVSGIEQNLQSFRWWGKLEGAQLEAAMAHYETTPFFLREVGDNVNDWIAQDSTSRVNKGWGEAAQLVQAKHYSNTLSSLLGNSRQDIGGCLWHPFDHQRGYHPDPFWGGILDAARLPKYSYWLFQAQRKPDLKIQNVDSGPMVRVLHQVAASSDADVCVVSNCDEIRLTVNGKNCGTRAAVDPQKPDFHPVVTWEGVYDFQDQKRLLRTKKHDQAAIVAEGLIDGKAVCKHVMPYAGVRKKIVLKADTAGVALSADGSDLLTVVAYVADERGNVKRLGSNLIQFEVSGAGRMFGGSAAASTGINPQATIWGEAVALIQSTTEAGTITVTAREVGDGPNKLSSATLTLRSVKSALPRVHSELPGDGKAGEASASSRAATGQVEVGGNEDELRLKIKELEKELIEMRKRETARVQEDREVGQ